MRGQPEFSLPWGSKALGNTTEMDMGMLVGGAGSVSKVTANACMRRPQFNRWV